MKLNQRQVQHFFLRAGFGQSIDVTEAHLRQTPEQLFDEQVAYSAQTAPVEVTTDFADPGELMNMSKEDRQQMVKEGRDDLRQLNVRWLKEMASSQAQLREKMAFFWHDHFACQSRNPKFVQGYLDAIRGHALENFGDLLRAVSKSPAMLKYLNNQQNRKSSPNENFAREVMELFTLGRDQGYTEMDISEAARAFTGWAFDREGQFKFRKFQHDPGTKTVLEKTGPLDGDEVIDILLAQKQTARYLSQKWVRFFVNSEGDARLERLVADELFQTNYDIKSGFEVLFTSPAFYAAENIGRRIKSPIELIASLQRQLHVTITHDESLLYLQKTLGQMLFNPPNVAGWGDGKDWVDSATLMMRINLPQLVFRSGLIQQEVDSYDDNDSFKIRGRLKKLEPVLDEKTMNKALGSKDFGELATYLLQSDLPGAPPKGDFIDQIIYITSRPEYQVC